MCDVGTFHAGAQSDIGRAIATLDCLREVVLSCPVGNSGVLALVVGFPDFLKCKKLKLPGCGINHDGGIALADGIVHLGLLQELDISRIHSIKHR